MAEVALLLPGQGSQRIRMAAGLYPGERVFAEAMDEVFAALGPPGDRLREDWLSPAPRLSIDDAAWSQPLLFAVGHALGRLVCSWGVRPAALLGHSVGELAAATLAGVFRLPDAVALVLDRVARAAAAPPGGMLAVAASAAELAPFLGDGVTVGAVNAPRHTVLAGAREPLAAVAAALTAAGLAFRPVPSLCAFHSAALAPAFEGAESAVGPRRTPRLTVYSGYTGAPLGPAEVADAAFWATQPVAPVHFWSTLDSMLGDGEFVLVECGAGQELSKLARRHPAVRAGRSSVLPLLPSRAGTPDADRAAVLTARTVLTDARGS
ncbi:Acyl transferase domain-containing protein [Amycolatopsis xylanica]|uniref:Acyl transferase domain-containing protein n=1 Tax=Amycolatopsis xylanica TaxID=589385 RepID=A0A1H2VTF7_9PSEU|nr:acyltransferase domain-containing protein [Amycolatopsis xylanica]SDW71511.1 Acyl transferase domain-containing protein [Amycolatopsis xylanica]